MKKAHFLYILVSLASVLCFLFSIGQAQAQTDVICDPTGATTPLQDAIYDASPGDTLVVNGTCLENVVISEYQHYITLQGGVDPIINGPDPAKPTIDVHGKFNTIKGLTITGGLYGIAVSGRAYIENNTIENAASNGINVSVSGFAQILNNTIQNNPGYGILIGGNATAFIGINSPYATVASPNTIQNNDIGIQVTESSSAWIVGNTISDNTNDGVKVVRCSFAHISNNTINENGGDGILVANNSGVNLGIDNSTSLAINNLPNQTTVKNGRYGIECTVGGYISKYVGSLSGVLAPVAISKGCVKNLQIPPSAQMLVGSWSKVYSNTTDAPDQVTYNVDGTGIDSNSTTFNWTVQGTKLTITETDPPGDTISGLIYWQGANRFKYVYKVNNVLPVYVTIYQRN